MASGQKRILLSPVSPGLQSANKKIADFPTPKSIKSLSKKYAGPTSPSCCTSPGFESESKSVIQKRLSSPVEKRSRKKLFDSVGSEHFSVSSEHLINSVAPVIACTPSCATPVKASSTDLENLRDIEQLCARFSPLYVNIKQKVTSVPVHFKNDTPLTEDELLLYALMTASFPSDTFTKNHSIEKYDNIVQVIDNIIGVHYSSQSVRHYFHRVLKNKVKGVGKTKGVLRWRYFKDDIWNVMHSQAEVLQSLLQGNILKESDKVSLLEQLRFSCTESMSQKENKEPSQVEETVLTKPFEINEVSSIFQSDIKPALVREWSFQEYTTGKIKTLLFYCFGNCGGYAEREVQLNANGNWCLYVEGIQRETDLEWTECPQIIKTFQDIPDLLNCFAKLTVCQGCEFQKYETVLPPESEYGQPVFMTKDGKPAAFVERIISKAKQKIIRSDKCLILLPQEEAFEISNCCSACKSAGHYLRTLKSRKMMTDKTEQSKNIKSQYMSKEELLNLARKSAKELKYLQLKVKRLEEHKKKMIALGPKSDNDLKFLFLKLQKGVETRKEKLQNPVCKWGECQEKFENVEELFCHCKKHIDNLDTATIAPVNREYPCQWENCTKTYMKLKLLHNHIRDHTGNAKDEFLEILLKDQAKALNTTARQMRWHPLVIQWCLRIYCRSHSLYNEMRLSGALKLPSGRTLSDYKNFNSPKSGWHSETIEAMKTKFDKMKPPKHAKLGGLFFDEVKIKEGLVFDSSTWELIGFTDIKDDNSGTDTSITSEIATHVLQFFFRSTFFKFDFPCAYFLTKEATSIQINRVFWLGVSMLHSHNFEVILACCDGASPNRSFVTMNTTNETHSKGFNPFSGYPIFFFSDPPHLIKKLRNNLYKSGFKEQNKRFTRTMRRNGKYILWDHIVAVFNREKKRCLFATDLRNSHINLDNLSKMRVKFAVQTLSSKVADDMSKFENNATLSTQEYIVQCEKFWKVFNDQTPIRVETDVRIHMLEEVLAYFVEWKESLPAMYDTKSEQGQHFIAWQTMFDLQVMQKNDYFN